QPTAISTLSLHDALPIWCELEGIHYLRTLGNSETIREDAAGKKVVLIGGSYIGCEVAASLIELGSSCEIAMLEPVVLSRSFGEEDRKSTRLNSSHDQISY